MRVCNKCKKDIQPKDKYYSVRVYGINSAVKNITRDKGHGSNLDYTVDVDVYSIICSDCIGNLRRYLGWPKAKPNYGPRTRSNYYEKK